MDSIVHNKRIQLQMVVTAGPRMGIHAQQTLLKIVHIKMDHHAAILLAVFASHKIK